jgi:hypothetical protein
MPPGANHLRPRWPCHLHAHQTVYLGAERTTTVKSTTPMSWPSPLQQHERIPRIRLIRRRSGASKPVGGGEAAVGLAGAGVGGRGAVALEHLTRLPAGQAHQVGLAAALGQPLWAKVCRNWWGCSPGRPAWRPRRRSIITTPYGVSRPLRPIHSQGRSAYLEVVSQRCVSLRASEPARDGTIRKKLAHHPPPPEGGGRCAEGLSAAPDALTERHFAGPRQDRRWGRLSRPSRAKGTVLATFRDRVARA